MRLSIFSIFLHPLALKSQGGFVVMLQRFWNNYCTSLCSYDVRSGAQDFSQ